MPDAPQVLCLDQNALHTVNPGSVDDVRSMWEAFSRAKNCIPNGERLEYLSWRLYSREILPHKLSRPVDIPCSSDSNGLDAAQNPSSTNLPNEPPPLAMSSSAESLPRQKLSSQKFSELFEPLAKSSDARDPKCSVAASAYQTQFRSRHSSPNASRTSSGHTSRANTPGVTPSVTPSVTRHNSAISHTSSQILGKSSGQYAGSAASALSNDGLRGRPGTSDASALRTVRGFSPSNISVAVNRSSANLLQKAEPAPAPRKDTSRWSKAEIPRNKMFFIEGSSDSEAGSADSVDMPALMQARDGAHEQPVSLSRESPAARSHDQLSRSPTKPGSQGGLPGGLHGGAHGGLPGGSHGPSKSKVAFADVGSLESHLASDQDLAFESEDNFEGDGDESEWDDMDEYESDDGSSDGKDMFSERAVPLRPSVKHSLLSSLILNKDLKEAQALDQSRPLSRLKPRSGSSASTASEKSQQGQNVAAPVNILLGAQVGGHFPMPQEVSPDTVRKDIDSELSQSIKDNLLLSRGYELESIWSNNRLKSRNRSRSRSRSRSSAHAVLDAHNSGGSSRTSSAPGSGQATVTPSRQNSRPTSRSVSRQGSQPGSRTASTAVSRQSSFSRSMDRPNLLRTATEPVRPPSPMLETPWSHSDDDIYDPLNYHSRGW